MNNRQQGTLGVAFFSKDNNILCLNLLYSFTVLCTVLISMMNSFAGANDCQHCEDIFLIKRLLFFLPSPIEHLYM